jgi:Sigma 54 modulation/S30EA ribosomal protein C terminus
MFDDDELLEDLNIENKLKAKAALPVDIDADAVRKKIFEMPPITLSEAISSLELVDHPFFVFRNAVSPMQTTSASLESYETQMFKNVLFNQETTEVNVVYKKNDGGVGHISPLVQA